MPRADPWSDRRIFGLNLDNLIFFRFNFGPIEVSTSSKQRTSNSSSPTSVPRTIRVQFHKQYISYELRFWANEELRSNRSRSRSNRTASETQKSIILQAFVPYNSSLNWGITTSNTSVHMYFNPSILIQQEFASFFHQIIKKHINFMNLTKLCEITKNPFNLKHA